MMNFDIPFDILIAGGVLLLALIVLLLSRMKFLPQKSLPFIAAALGAAFGFALFKKSREKAGQKKIEALENLLKEKERRLGELKADATESRRQADEAKAQLQDAIVAAQKEVLLIEQNRAEEREAISAMSPADTFALFRKNFGKPQESPND